MIRVGMVAIDVSGRWMGGRYYLQHLVRCVASLPEAERVAFYDIYWNALPDDDPFADVRPWMAGRRVLRFPETFLGRVARKGRRMLTRRSDAGDLFAAAGIDVTFPVPLIENQGVPLLFWLPDLQQRWMPELYDPAHVAEMNADMARLGEQATRIVASSQKGLDDIARFLPHLAPKVDIVRFCSVPEEQWWSVDPVTYCRGRGFADRFFALSNQITEHKNHRVVIEALRLLRDRGVRLHVVSTGSTFDFRSRGTTYFDAVTKLVRDYGLEDQFTFCGLLPRGEQIAILRRSIAMLQPSKFEGWSTIVEDAKTLGKPIIASDIEVHREQLGDEHRWYAGVEDAEQWARWMEELAATAAPGPNPAEEAAGLAALEVAKRRCGQAFVQAIRNAVR